MSLLQVERSSLDAVLIAVSAAYEALEDHAEYKVAFGEAHTIPVNEKARIRDKAGEAIDTLQYLLREALEAPNAQHPDDIAVDKFSAAMKAKMAKQRANGYSGWDNKGDCPTERLQQMLADHIAKGDPVDVGNFAMMLWNRGEDTAAPKALAPELVNCDTCVYHYKEADQKPCNTCVHARDFYDNFEPRVAKDTP